LIIADNKWFTGTSSLPQQQSTYATASLNRSLELRRGDLPPATFRSVGDQLRVGRFALRRLAKKLEDRVRFLSRNALIVKGQNESGATHPDENKNSQQKNAVLCHK
jgi:hypothetical protein